MSTSPEFVAWFRSAAPYIRTFRGQTFVIAFDGDVIDEGNFTDLTHDINLLVSVGVRVVLVHGARPQIERSLKSKKLKSNFSNHQIRVTDEETLTCVKEANGRLRLEIEALLSMGLPNTPLAGSPIRVTSGNFVIAQPKGIINGTDMLYSGDVRKVRHEAIIQRLEDGELVLLSPLGYSATGEIFNLTHEDVATEVAIAVKANKLIYLCDQAGINDKRGNLLHELTASEIRLIEKKQSRAKVPSQAKNRIFQGLIKASDGGVDRLHLIDRKINGGILLELFTHEGIGTMISQDSLENIRTATQDDIGGILNLIEPLEKEGVLVKRPRETLETEIKKFTIVEHDGLIIGCGALNPFGKEKVGELACLAVHPDFQNAGVGERLLKVIETNCKKEKLKNVFVLTTKSSHWFLENGFKKTLLGALPKEKAKLYNYQRNSKIYNKELK
ncbi:amino-acid N-acetyltransferase [Burkholderiales bacterium]|jgi:amino-acid N-acetyltransferase|nr:amino-acid N-acetyltransferase [Burkholderiales bacterium]HAT52525.1 amino-acid N-acetyltransferase [Betaproteobacteria bacterium]